MSTALQPRARNDARRTAATSTAVEVVRRVDPNLSVETVTAALDRVASTPNRCTPLVAFLASHPEALTSSSSRVPKTFGLFVEAGATGLVVPRCADCGQPKELFHTKGADRICRDCYERAHTGQCGECGKTARIKGRTPDGRPRCQACQNKANTVACARCGRVRPVNYSRADGKPYCRGCRARNKLEDCAGCGNLRPVNTRTADGRGYCGTCYAHGKAPEVCAECGTTAPVAARREDGSAECAKCHAHPLRACGACGRTRRVALRATATTPDICPTCYQAPEITCSVCGTTDLGRRTTADGRPMCFRCQATRLVDHALSGPDGTIAEALLPVRDAIVSADNPRSILSNFAGSKSLALLSTIARGDRALSHKTLDEHAGRHSVEHLRSLLVAADALPARDEHLQRLQRFTTELLDTVDDPADRRLLAAFARWHLLARLRLRTAGALTPGAAYRCRAELTAAHRFLEFLHGCGHDLAGCRQDDIDTWFGQRAQHVAHNSRAVLRWARRQRHLDRDIQIPKQGPHQPKHFRAEDTRWDLARRMLHDPAAGSVRDRVAACLVLLYAQPPARIVTLSRGHVRTTDHGDITLRLGGTEITIPPPLDALLSQLPLDGPQGAAARLNHSNWLFPGRRPGHLHPTSLAHRLRALGVDPRADRNTALGQLAAEVPAAVLADMLGLHINTAINWANDTAGDWTNYAAARSLAR